MFPKRAAVALPAIDAEREFFFKNELISKGAADTRNNFQCYKCSLLISAL